MIIMHATFYGRDQSYCRVSHPLIGHISKRRVTSYKNNWAFSISLQAGGSPPWYRGYVVRDVWVRSSYSLGFIIDLPIDSSNKAAAHIMSLIDEGVFDRLMEGGSHGQRL